MRRSFLGTLLLACALEAGAACSVSTSGISFGSYDVFAPGHTQSSGTVVVACSDVPPVDVTLSLGPSASSGSIVPRRMRAATGSDRLDYNVFVDSSYTRVWGNGIGGGETIFLRNVIRNRPRTVRFYGRINAGQDVGIGTYSDSLTLTFTP